MSYLAAAAIAFGLTFLVELPDKSLFASLVLGTRYRPLYVWTGAAAAFAVQMAIAVTAGQLLSLLPRHLVDGIVAALFVAGAAYLWITSFREQRPEGADAARQGGPPASFLRIAGTSFVSSSWPSGATSLRSPRRTWPPAIARWPFLPGRFSGSG